MKHIADIFTPNKKVSDNTGLTIALIWLIGTIIFWFFSGHRLVPSPFDIATALKTLVTNKVQTHNIVPQLMISTTLCLKALFYSILVSFGFAVLSVFPIFKPLANISGKARFLSTAGLTFIFAQITADTNSMKVTLLVFCISVFMITSFLSIIFETKKEELDYARTLKLGNWQSLWEVMILGKVDQYLEAIKQNFAIAWIMLAMVENLCRAEGGIGVILTEENKHFHMDSVYAIQIVVLLVGIGLDWMLGFIRRVFCPYSVLTLNK
jgi:ABC-type nitrate/sulfonate/bicarbonate transport system permease component